MRVFQVKSKISCLFYIFKQQKNRPFMPETTGSQAAQGLDVFVVLAVIPVFVALLRAMEISKMILRALHSVPKHA